MSLGQERKCSPGKGTGPAAERTGRCNLNLGELTTAFFWRLYIRSVNNNTMPKYTAAQDVNTRAETANTAIFNAVFSIASVRGLGGMMMTVCGGSTGSKADPERQPDQFFIRSPVPSSWAERGNTSI